MSDVVELKGKYPGVDRGGVISYGGSQLWSDSQIIRKCGCGPVAALDLLLYLGRVKTPLSCPEYNAMLDKLCRKYTPLLPPVGINAAVLTLGLNSALREGRLPYTAHVSPAGGRTVLMRIEAGLCADTPVLLAVGRNFPVIWGDKRVNFYVRLPDGQYRTAASTKAHFVAVTGMDGEMLRVSSWGRMYYISGPELLTYIREYSAGIMSSLVYVSRKC